MWQGIKMHIHFIIHEHFEAPGAYESWAKNRGYTVSYSRVHEGEKPSRICWKYWFFDCDGGPQNPSTTIEQCPHFDTKSEQSVISKAINAGRLCLVSAWALNWIGEALGASYEHSPEREIGKFPYHLDWGWFDASVVWAFCEALDVGHWHNDMPGLTDSKIIAYSEGCPSK